ncbi:MAG TPA: NAD-dependent epimerase/dehydratase family protein, partial [Ktedonobacteraceae bacterium]|nr:NAD-dependent epimerase/dehydratase family protein [Ktedonobacteraceae bacterium]
MRVLVTGGAGFIGSHLATLLLKNGHKVRAFDNLEPQVHGVCERPTYLAPAVELIRGDVRDRASLLSALEGVDAIFHFAAMVGVGQSQYQIMRYTSTNVLGSATLLDILANERHAVRKLVVASSMSIYGEGLYRRPSDGLKVSPPPRSEEQLAAGQFEVHDPETHQILEPLPTPEDKPLKCESIYALNKKDQEEYFLFFGRTYGVPVTACRFFNVYGPYQSLSNPYTGAAAIFISRIKNTTPPLIYEDGMQSRDFIDVRDIAAGCLLVLEDPRADGQVFNIGTGQRVSILQLAEILIDLSGQRLKPEIVYRYRKGDIRHCFSDITAARKLGFSPAIPLHEGLRHLYAWAKTIDALDHVQVAHSELVNRGLVGR